MDNEDDDSLNFQNFEEFEDFYAEADKEAVLGDFYDLEMWSVEMMLWKKHAELEIMNLEQELALAQTVNDVLEAKLKEAQVERDFARDEVLFLKQDKLDEENLKHRD